MPLINSPSDITLAATDLQKEFTLAKNIQVSFDPVCSFQIKGVSDLYWSIAPFTIDNGGTREGVDGSVEFPAPRKIYVKSGHAGGTIVVRRDPL